MDFRSFQEIQKIREKRQKPEQKNIQKTNRKKNEKHAKIMQKSDATPGSLQNPVSDQVWTILGGVREVKSAQNRKKGFPKRMRKNCRFLACDKYAKSGPPRGHYDSSAACAGPPGRFGGVQYTAKVCKNSGYHAMNFAKDFMQSSYLHLARPRVRRIQSLRALRRANLGFSVAGWI